ncbi:hypothetical protein ABPG74_006975 [Tetrahymena malaccensis]
MSNLVSDILNNEDKLNKVAKVAFDAVDTDGSGQINQSELKQVMDQITRNIGAQPPTQEEIDQVLKNLDTDGDGSVSFQEFKVLIKNILEAINELNQA